MDQGDEAHSQAIFKLNQLSYDRDFQFVALEYYITKTGM
jgi:hypothetical protein